MDSCWVRMVLGRNGFCLVRLKRIQWRAMYSCWGNAGSCLAGQERTRAVQE